MADETLDRKELEAWLTTQPREVSIVIAARAALRVFPVLRGVLIKAPPKHAAAIILSVCRATALPWAAARYPVQCIDLGAAAAAADAAYAAYTDDIVTSAAADAVYAAAVAARVAAASTAVDTVAAGAAVRAAAGLSSADLASLNFDRAGIQDGKASSFVAGSPLWGLSDEPDPMGEFWVDMKARLLGLDPDWKVWTDWYEDRLYGRPAIEGLEIARATLPDELWKQGPAVVNARIRELIEEYTPEPSDEPGLRAEVQDGKLTLHGSVPTEDERSDPLQQSLHTIVRRKARDLHDSLKPAANQYPELFKVATVYLRSVDVSMSDLDVATVWSEGNELDGLLEAYRGQDPARSMSEPLEPALSGKLSGLLKDHSGLILGFAIGRLLTERADRMRSNGLLPESLREPVLSILSAFRSARDVVEAETREIVEATEATMIEVGWPTGRVVYSGYALTRTLLLGAGRFLLKAGIPALGAVGGLAAVGQLSGDPQLIAAYQFALLFRDQAGAILQFAAGFPEVRRWLANILDHLETEHAQDDA